METSTYMSLTTTLRLEKIEEFRAENDKGLPFHVRQVMFSGGDTVQVSGAAIKTDGTRGYIDRYASIPLADLRDIFSHAIMRSRRLQIEQLLDGERKAGRFS